MVHEANFNDGVQEINADSWRDFVTYIQERLSNYRAYVFRGQRNPEWRLVPSIERIDGIKLLKNDTLAAFKAASRGRRGVSPAKLSTDEWWALGQHHGLKTPLLDWTESPFVAAFFAFLRKRNNQELPKERMVFALAKQQIAKKKEEVEKNDPGTLLTGTDAFDIVAPQVDDNSRLVSQRGLFTKYLGLNTDVESWIRKRFKGTDKAVFIKISIMESTGDREAFLRYLNRMNINHLSLFPDLDGAAEYCNMQLEIDDY